ncbi:uncharacterized protein LOC119556552 isoform X3 [Drosophila subpulchrella]|uniref:uncharacterized protein LOC119556552 isoform X3 n=1 Tax=Drosophila subpulchrella TaxID=1486046 RepID=UPI0018A12B6B|nr:uncharacterized protein LOC119556552 isoform X3 [Drosophila subpulchrella]
MFKLAFKQYKAKSSSPDLTEVINVDDIEARQNDPLQKDNNVQRLDISNSVAGVIGLLDVYGTIRGDQILST